MGWSRSTQRKWKGVCKWLLRSRHWALQARKGAIFRPPPDQPVLLPQYDDDPERERQLARERRRYELVPIAEKLDLPVSWNHLTLVNLPKEDKYTFRLMKPKLALVVALKKELMPPGTDERWDSV